MTTTNHDPQEAGDAVIRPDRRSVLGLLCLAPAAFAFTRPAEAHHINPIPAPRVVRYNARLRPGTIVVATAERRLYLVLGGGRARAYTVAVGAAGRNFRGSGIIARKAKWPRWTPTKNMIRREPHKYARYAGGVPGGPNNPLGSRALYLYRNGRDTMYRIHGTNNPASVGSAVSNGCVRLINAHVEDLYARVPIGARVIVQ